MEGIIAPYEERRPFVEEDFLETEPWKPKWKVISETPLDIVVRGEPGMIEDGVKNFQADL